MRGRTSLFRENFFCRRRAVAPLRSLSLAPCELMRARDPARRSRARSCYFPAAKGFHLCCFHVRVSLSFSLAGLSRRLNFVSKHVCVRRRDVHIYVRPAGARFSSAKKNNTAVRTCACVLCKRWILVFARLAAPCLEGHASAR